MSDRSPLRGLLLPLTLLYRLGLALREWRVRTGRKTIRRLRWPVVSVGNLSTGGAGKTPFTIALARALSRHGMQVDVLSRGYGRMSRSAARVDANGTSEEFGDEPLVIAREAGVPVYVSAERYDVGRLAEDECAAGESTCVHLLDDGFQHRQLAREVDILLLNGRDWRGRLLPAGNLREPRGAIRRAHVIAIPAHEAELESELKAKGWIGPIWRLRRKMEVPHVAGPAIAFCGIAQPEQFFEGLESAGLHLASRVVFADHHRYVAHDVDCLLDAARPIGAAALITTEKDRVRLGALTQRIPKTLLLETAKLRIEIDDEGAAIDWLLLRLSIRPLQS